MKISSLLSGLALTALVSASAFAQAPAATPQQPGQPEIKTIGDWAVRCYPVQSASPCDMFQQQNEKDSQQRILALSLAYIPHLDRHAIQVVVPLGVAIQKGVVIHTASYSAPAMAYRRCDKDGRLLFAGVTDNKPIAIPLSLKGYADAKHAYESSEAKRG